MKEKQPLNSWVFIGAIALVALVVGYLVWTRSGPSAPTLSEGQSLQNPFGKMDTKNAAIPSDTKAAAMMERRRVSAPASGQ